MTVDPTLIRGLSFFKDFSEKDLQRMADLLGPRHVESDTLVLHQRDHRGGFFIVLDGMLSVFRQLPDGQDIFLARLSRGHVVGYLHLIDGQPRTANVKAVGDVLLGELSESDFRVLLTSNSALGLRFQQAVARDIVRSIRQVNRRFTIAATLPIDQFFAPAHLDGLYDDFERSMTETPTEGIALRLPSSPPRR